MALTAAQLDEIEKNSVAHQKVGFAADRLKNQIDNALGVAAASAALAPTYSGEYTMAIANAAETNTCTAPAFAGQVLAFGVTSRAGTGTRAITFASAINATGNTVATFNATTDILILQAVTVAGTPAWRVMNSDGVALS
jgi:hypothetical protein